MRITLQPALVLHTRPFGDTSLLVELLTLEYGRVSLLARNARGMRSQFKGIVQPFVPLLVSWSGKTELMSLSKAELNGQPYLLVGTALLCGIYLNELLIRLLQRDDPHPPLFTAYQTALTELQQANAVEKVLRLFEKKLLQEIGYGIDFAKDIAGNPIEAQLHYCWYPEKGFAPVATVVQQQVSLFQGKHILSLQQNKLETTEECRAAKHLFRLLLSPLLGDRPIRSRELF